MSLVLDFQNGLRNMGPDGFWEILGDIGWTDLIPKSDRNALRSRIEEAFEKDPTEGYKAMAFRPHVTNRSIDDEDRSWVIRNFADASFGTFNPVKVEFRISRYAVHSDLSFKHKGRTYKGHVHIWQGNLGDDVVDLVNEAMADTGNECRFIRVDSLDDVAHLVFVTEPIFKLAQRKGLMPPKDYSFAYYR